MILFFMLLSWAAVLDIRKRMIPNWMTLLLAGVSLIPSEPVYFSGMLAVLPFFVAGITLGGIGGGDIKLIAACGLVLGVDRTFAGVILGLCFLLIYHAVRQCRKKIRKGIFESEKEQAYPLVPFLTFGMLFSIRIGGYL